ncbi:MAG: DEAD/DEAH box helicase [Kiritimatiellia bacterium]
MVELHLEMSEDGRAALSAQAPAAAGAALRPLSGDALLEAVREVVWYADELTPLSPARVCPSMRNLLMFLSDVRGRRFKPGCFLDASVCSAAESFRQVAAEVAEGRYLAGIEGSGDACRAVWRLMRKASGFEHALADALIRRAGWSVLEADDGRHETVDDAWLAALRSETGRIRWAVADDLDDLAKRLKEWRAPLRASASDRAALVFRLDPPPGRGDSWSLSMPAPPTTRLGLISLGQAASVYPPLRTLRRGRADLSAAEAENFLRAGRQALTAAGFSVEIPEGILGDHLSAVADVAPLPGEPVAETADAPVATARLSIQIDGEPATEQELQFLLDQDAPFVFFRDRWIEVDRSVLREALRALRSTRQRKLSVRETLRFAMGVQRAGRLRIARVEARGWLRGLLNELKGRDRLTPLPAPNGLKGTLRDYQVRGFSWLAFLVKWGFGACLADDMGLGKTLQAIAYLLHRKEQGAADAPALVVSPVSVTTNWMRELKRFAPGLRTLLHQGPRRWLGRSLRRACSAADVVVTGYSLLVKDWEALRAVGFGVLILDEAQMIKNPDTRVARAARALAAPVKIALTGTPLENSARDLWSLEECLNPGLLGARKDFEEIYLRPFRADARTAAAGKLRHVLEPFLLRRLKTDPGIAAELGGKREIREYCPLSPAQRAQYEMALEAFRADCAADSPAAARRGRTLALLTELKLICDGDGKMARLDELLADIFAAGESCLIFTQYAKVGRRLQAHLQEKFGVLYPFLHGGLSPAAREREIAAFNGSPEPNAFVLSLKAGGFGLNLTRATHVVHFDRWWNPAVENQATDRAHRIGQTRTVFVHLLLCAGTLEDHIDELLESKRLLANEVVTGGEAFLLNMGPEELEKTLALDDAQGDGAQGDGG